MRTLSKNEINSISGAGYSEDIVTVAASVYVGSAIGNAASAFSATAFTSAVNLIGTVGPLAPLGYAVGTLGSVVTPVMFFAAPLFVFDAVYPGVIAEKVEGYLN